jgi:DNA-binding SARP family transcriptional activator/streptogramin lyase
MEFRILGPLEVIDGPRTVALGGSKQRALLAILLLRANEVVGRDRLIEDLWGDHAPGTASTALHGYVSQLRKALEPSRREDEHRVLITRAPGYLLRVDPEQFDLRRFEGLVRQAKRELAGGDAQTASSMLAEALALWRGPPLAELGSAPFISVESLRLQELRLSAREERIEAELSLGHHVDIVGELETLVAEHPLRERLRGQLMLALYRSGRQAEALETYRRSRQTLVEELGIDPGIELQQLEKAILNHDRALELPAGTPPSESEQTETIGMQGGARRPAAKWLGIGIALVALLGLALGLTFALRGRESAAKMLVPNSVGFIDAKSGRVTRSFAVGREPRALAVGFDSVWVANYRDQTVTQVDPVNGHRAVIPVGGHPTGMVAYRGTVWVWTLEGLLVPIDPRYGSAGKPVSLVHGIIGARSRGGRITTGGGFLWIAARPTTVIRVDAVNPRDRRRFLAPDEGVQGAIAYHGGKVWVGGAYRVFAIAPDMETIASSGANVGVVRDLAFGAGSLWVVSGASGGFGGVVPALRPIDPHTGVVQATITVGVDPVAVAVAADSVWVASRSDGILERVDPAQDRVVDTTRVGASPVALAADKDGLWVAVR